MSSSPRSSAPKKILKERYLSDERLKCKDLDINEEEKNLKNDSCDDEDMNSRHTDAISMTISKLNTLDVVGSENDELRQPSPMKKVEFSPVNHVKLIHISTSGSVSKRLAASRGLKSRTPIPFIASPKSPSRPALKMKLNSNSRAVNKYSKLKLEDETRVELLKKGALLQKWTNGGKREERFFWINEDGSELRWAKPNIKSLKLEVDLAAGNVSTSKITSYKKVELADVAFMVFGPRTKKFVGFNWLTSHPENCFSVILPEGDTVDIECVDREEFMNWYLGIRSLAPLSRKTFDRAKVNWHRALYRTMQFAKNNDMDCLDVWHELAAMSRAGGDDADSLTEVQLKLVLQFNGESVLLHRGAGKKRRDQLSVIQTRREVKSKTRPPIIAQKTPSFIIHKSEDVKIARFEGHELF